MEKQQRNKPILKNEISFILMHLVPLGMIWTGATTFDWIICASLYFARMFFVTAGYHRYFAHKTYSTSRVFQFILAFLAETSAQKGALWWAAHHRIHHRYSDLPEDPHSAKLYGFWYSHIGWIMGPDYKETEYKYIKDLAAYKELNWLNKHYLVPPVILAICVFFAGAFFNSEPGNFNINNGWSTLIIGFFTSTLILYHRTFSINSLMHMIGKPRYESGDKSKNSFILALVTLGEGWHNNHHYYMDTVRQGFYWWELDITFYVLKIFSWFGLIWNLKPVPKYIKDSRNKEEAKQLKEELQSNK